MIQPQLKVRLTRKQEATLDRWLWHLTGVWNWGVRKIELDTNDGIYYSAFEFQNLLAGHSKKIGILSHVMVATLLNVHTSWVRCFNHLAKKPRLKGSRNKLNSIPFPDPFRKPTGNFITVPGLGRVRFHKQNVPDGKIKCGRMIKRASGWHLCLFVDAQPNVIPITGNGRVGIDPGYENLLTLSTGEKIKNPRELEHSMERIKQSQRGKNKRLTARLHERIANRRKDRNHKLTRRLVSENAFIAFSKDDIGQLSRWSFGKSATSAGHGQIRRMLSCKCRTGGRIYVEPKSYKSTMTCSKCGALTGPTGRGCLKVRRWTCVACGAIHDRDVNSAMNALIAGVGMTHERAA